MFVHEYSKTLQAHGMPVLSGNIYCVGRNYANHAKELHNEIPKEPVIFLKAPSALRGLNGPACAFPEETFHHEAEIVLLLGKEIAMGSQPDWSAVSGITLGLDLTRRGVQDSLKKQGLPWTIAKSFQGAGVLAAMQPISKVNTDEALRFELSVNGELRQRGNSEQMLFSVPQILTYLASLQTLYPGDIIFTGTPEGVGPMKANDTFVMRFLNTGHNFSGIL